ncbi:MAG TPA: ATP-binding protein [Hyphomicrobiales bacterium]|nr:ATP-binding protein [Hyphomicrobiales bacterium]
MPISFNLLKTSTFRLAAAYLFVFVLSVAAILAYVYWNTAVLLERQIDNSIEAEIAAFASEFQQTGLPGLLEAIDRRSQLDSNHVYLFTNPLGRRLAGNLNALPVAATGSSGWIDFSYGVETGRGLEHRAARAYYSEIEGGYRVVIGRDVDELRQFGGIIRTSLLWAVAITLVLGLSGGLLTSRNFLRRIDQITGTSRTIMAGDLSERMPVSGTGDELDRLASNLNAMLDQIERLMAGMQEISTNVAHDLRTPLSRLKARAEDALRSGSPDDHRQALEQVLEETDRLLATFNALLAIARAEAGQVGEKLQPVDAESVVREVAELYEPSVEEAGGRLAVSAAGQHGVRADRELLAQALANLIDNAMKYGTDGAAGPDISVSVGKADSQVSIEEADRGPGIPEPEREHVKERFVRLEPSRTRPGSGLGLSLVTGIMKLHGGRLELTGNAPGLRARLVLPSGEAPK